MEHGKVSWEIDGWGPLEVSKIYDWYDGPLIWKGSDREGDWFVYAAAQEEDHKLWLCALLPSRLWVKLEDQSVTMLDAVLQSSDLRLIRDDNITLRFEGSEIPKELLPPPKIYL